VISAIFNQIILSGEGFWAANQLFRTNKTKKP